VLSRAFRRELALLAVLALTAGDALAGSAGIAQTCRRDQSGIRWTIPFDAARSRAKAEQRLLFVKPIAFGTSSDGGW